MIKKLTAVILTALALCTFTLPTYAQTGGVADHTFEKVDYIKADTTLEQKRTFIVPEKGTFRVEEGATLYVYGELRVQGTLKNYGSIVVLDSTPSDNRRDKESLDTAGHISVSGVLENHGKLKVIAATMECTAAGEIKNEGTITLENETNPDITLFRVSGRKIPDGGTSGGKLTNTKTGVITSKNTVGKGFTLSKYATYINDGKVQKVK